MSTSGSLPLSISEVVKTGLCIGCGLCEAVTEARIAMRMTDSGSLRPSSLDGFSHDEEQTLLSVCPGISVEARTEDGLSLDTAWGSYSRMQYCWAADADVRFRAATGGALTALGVSLLKTRRVTFVLHVCADPERPMRSQWIMSHSRDEVAQRSGSRYGPTAPLAGFINALDRGQKFAIIAKPCDLSAVHNYSKIDPRVDALCVARLALVCGGQSKLSKSKLLLSQLELEEEDLMHFRYRGFGNPGLTRIETKDGRTFEVTYNELWEDQNTWDLETRCKFCADALGEAADIAASDVWPGGGPVGEDAGFNGIITRSQIGNDIVDDAVTGGDLILGDPISAEQYNALQPHQLRRKQALTARFEARATAGLPVMRHDGLRLEELSHAPSSAEYRAQFTGTLERIRNGRMTE